MLYVVRSDASIVEVDDAVEGKVRGELLACLDCDGKTVRVFPAAGIVAYGTNEVLKGPHTASPQSIPRQAR